MAENANEALIRAASSGSLKGVMAALKAGADVDFCMPFGPQVSWFAGTALWNAARAGHVHVVQLLLRKGASLVKRASEYGHSALHGAAEFGQTEVIEVLIHHGATVDISDTFKMTPLMEAIMAGQAETVRQLVGFGARVDFMLDQDPKRFSIQWQNELHELMMTSKKRECLKLVEDARETRLLRCCNPKCKKPGYRPELPKCAQCKLVRYCSRECQKHHWSGGHKKCCGQDEFQRPPCDVDEALRRGIAKVCAMEKMFKGMDLSKMLSTFEKRHL